MKHKTIKRQETSNFSNDSTNHGGKSITDILSVIFFCFMVGGLSYMFIIKQADEVEQQAIYAAEYQAQFKNLDNERNY